MLSFGPHRAWLALLLTTAIGCHRQPPEHEILTARPDGVRIELGRVSDGQAHFFTFQHEGKNVNFFVRTDREGELRTHFDACFSCFKYKRGYVQEGKRMVCIACRIGYDLDTPVWDYVGPCVPVTLKSRLEKGSLLIRVSDLRKGGRFF